MTAGSRSYLKTVILAAAGGALIIAATLVGSAFETGPAKSPRGRAHPEERAGRERRWPT